MSWTDQGAAAQPEKVSIASTPSPATTRRKGAPKRQVHHRIKKLIIDASLTAEAVVSYMADAQPTGDYYTEGGSAVMMWLATERARTSFALGPEVGARVSRHAMASLLRGQHPVTGATIRRAGQHDGEAVMVGGIDVTINPAPKSVSVLWAMADDELRQTIEKHVYLSATRAITRMLDEVPMVRDRYGPASNDVRHVLAQDWVGVQAIHTTARLTAHKGVPDPQLHVHNVLIGALDHKGKLRALDTLPMTRYHRELDAEATSALAETFRRMGFPIRRIVERKKSGAIKTVKWELDGIPGDLVKAMSARTREIEDLKRQYEKHTGREADGPGWESFIEQQRGPKAKLSPTVMTLAWRDEAAEHGYTPEVHTEHVRRAQVTAAAGVEERKGRTGPVQEQLRREILDELCREYAIVPRAELDRLLVQLSTGLMDPFTAMGVVASMYRDGDLLATTDGMVTTLEVLATEQRATRAAEALLAAESGPAADPAELEAEFRRVEEEGAPFEQRQRHAVELATSGARLVSITGPAGTGKGHASASMVAIWQAQGRRVIAAAVQGITAQQAQADSGADEARTLAGLEWDLATQRVELQPSDVVFVDEAGMIGHRLYAPLLEAVAEAGATLVQVGDEKQLSPIEAGGLWTVVHGMADKNGVAAELREIRRALNPEEAQAWTDLRDGRVEKALTWYRDRGLLRLYDTRPELLQGMLEEWWACGPGRGVMVLDTSNEERDELNAMAQARRLEAGELGAEVLRLENGREIRAGERVLFDAIYYPGPGAPPKMSQAATFAEQAPTRATRVENGTRATVVSVDMDAGTAVLQLHEPKPKPPRRAKSQAATLPTQARTLTVPVVVPLELGYARHVYKSQGMTVEVANVATGPHTPHNQLHVMVTRSRDGTRIHTLRSEVESMGADPGVLDEPAAAPRGVSGDDLVAELLAGRRPELDTTPLYDRRAQHDRDDHLTPSERRYLEMRRTEPEADALPPGAIPVSEFMAKLQAERDRVRVPIHDHPAVWQATISDVARRAQVSTTKKAIGRPMWSATAAEGDRQDRAEEIRQEHWQAREPGRGEDHDRQLTRTSPPRTGMHAGEPERERWPAALPGREALDTAARDHARWCDAPKVLASYELAGHLDIASDPVDQAARRWLADPAAVIVVADQDQEQLVREAVARLRQSEAATAAESDGRSRTGPPQSTEHLHAPYVQVAASDLNRAAELPLAAAAYARRLAELPPRGVRPDEPRVYIADRAYAERKARRAALGFRNDHPAVEPGVEPRAYVVAPIAPGSGWSYREMTRALSVAATTHLISPQPNSSTASATRREATELSRSLAADRSARQGQQAEMAAEFADVDRRRARTLDRARDRGAQRDGALR